MPEQGHTELVWGPMVVTPVACYERITGNGSYRVLRVSTDHQNLDIYVSPTGRSVRVFRGSKELKAAQA